MRYATKGGALNAIRGIAAALAASALMLAMLPGSALAYFDRGAVEVSLGASSLEMAAGETASITMSFSPAVDEQTEGCGMPKCPQSCASTCTDENGQCRCAGTEYQTYYPSARASSSDAGVATARCDGNSLSIQARSAGDAVITVRASLRQHSDSEAKVAVHVAPGAAAADRPAAATADVPAEADVEQDDKADLVVKTVMGRPVHAVRINERCDGAARLAALAGVDGDVTFWSGDTLFQPDYSLTFTGSDYDADAVGPFDPEVTVSTEAEGKLYQLLAGADGFVSLDFSQQGALPAEAKVYARCEGVLEDGAEVRLFSYDEASKGLVAEDAEASVEDGYLVFAASEGKTYVASVRDLARQAAADAPRAAADGSGASPMASSTVSLWAVIAIGALIAAVAIAFGMLRRSGKEPDGNRGER